MRHVGLCWRAWTLSAPPAFSVAIAFITFSWQSQQKKNEPNIMAVRGKLAGGLGRTWRPSKARAACARLLCMCALNGHSHMPELAPRYVTPADSSCTYRSAKAGDWAGAGCEVVLPGAYPVAARRGVVSCARTWTTRPGTSAVWHSCARALQEG